MAEETTNTSTETAGSEQSTSNAQNSQNSSNQSQQTNENKPATDIEKLIQRAVDRATNKLGNENKNLREQLENFKKEKLSDDELKELAIKDREAEIAKREAALLEKENRLFAIKAIKEAGLDDGSQMSLDLVDFVMAEKTEDITKKVNTFKTLVNSFVKSEVDKTFKENGRKPIGGQSTGDKNDKSSVAAKLGKVTAETNKKSQEVLNQYIGG